ncbi:MAG: DnaJ domain-containing protein [Spirochaetota bacterium]
MARDPYEILGVSRYADDEEIRRAYRRLAKQEHPDTEGGGDEDYFCALNDAYEKVRTEERRRATERRNDEQREQRRSRSHAPPWSRPRTRGRASRPGKGFAGAGGDIFDDFDMFSSFSGLSDMLWRMFGRDVSGFGRRASHRFGRFDDSEAAGRSAARRYRVSVELSAREAADGVSFDVRLPDGARTVEIPPGVRDGDELLYSEEAAPGRRVDLDVSVRVE